MTIHLNPDNNNNEDGPHLPPNSSLHLLHQFQNNNNNNKASSSSLSPAAVQQHHHGPNNTKPSAEFLSLNIPSILLQYFRSQLGVMPSAAIFDASHLFSTKHHEDANNGDDSTSSDAADTDAITTTTLQNSSSSSTATNDKTTTSMAPATKKYLNNVRYLLLLEPYVLKRYLLEENMDLLEPLIYCLYHEMKQAIRGHHLYSERELLEGASDGLRINAFNEEGILGEVNHKSTLESTASSTPHASSFNHLITDPESLTDSLHQLYTQQNFSFLFYLQIYMKILNWFNREKQELTNGVIATVFEHLLELDSVKRQLLDMLESSGDSESESATTTEGSIPQTFLGKVYEILSYTKSFHLFKLYSDLEERFLSNLPLDVFFDIENHLSSHSDNSHAPSHFYQNSFLYYSFLNKKNPVQLVFDACLEAIGEKNFSRLKLLVEPEMFHPLKALVFVVAWDILDSDVMLLRGIFHVLFSPPENQSFGNSTEPSPLVYSQDETLDYSCRYLKYLLDLADWIMNHSSTTMKNDIHPDVFAQIYGKEHAKALMDGSLDASFIAHLVMKHMHQSYPLLHALAPWIGSMDHSTLIDWILQYPQAHYSKHSIASTLDAAHVFHLTRCLLNFLLSNQSDIDNEQLESMKSWMREISVQNRVAVLRCAVNLLLVSPKHTTNPLCTSLPCMKNILLLFQNELYSIASQLSETNEETHSTNSNTHHNLLTSVKDILWRLDFSKEYLVLPEGSVCSDTKNFVLTLLQSPESMIINALHRDDMKLARTIYKQYSSTLSKELQTEYLDAEFYHKHTNNNNPLPLNDHHHLLNFLFLSNDFTTDQLEQLVKSLSVDENETAAPQWLSNFSLVTQILKGIQPKDFASMSYTLCQILPQSKQELRHYLTSRNIPSQLRQSIDSMMNPDPEKKQFLSQQEIREIKQYMDKLTLPTSDSTNSTTSLLSQFLTYIEHSIHNTSDLQTVQEILQVNPRRLVQKCAFEEKDFDRASSLAELYSIDLMKVILSKFSDANFSISPEMLSYFDKKSPVFGLFARVLLEHNSSADGGQEKWDSILILCKEQFPQLSSWIQTLKQVNQLKHLISYAPEKSPSSAVASSIHSSTELVEKLSHLSFDALTTLTKKDHPLGIFIPVQRSTETLENIDKEHSSLMYRFQNLKHVFLHFQRVYTSWSIDEGINLLQYLLSSLYVMLSKNRRRSRMRQNPLLLEVGRMLHRLTVVREICLHLGDETLSNWQSIAESIRENPDDLIERILCTENFALAQTALSVCTQQVNSSLSHLVHSRQVINILKGSDQTECINFLEDMTALDALQACRMALDGEHTDFDEKLFLCKYIITALKDELSPQDVTQYNHIFLSLKILSLLDEDTRNLFYERLKTSPDLIVENLLLASRIDDVALVMRKVPEVHNDHILIAYGLKALAMRVNNESDWKQEWVWGEDEQHDETVRNSHFYPQAPSVVLSKRILDMVQESGKAGEGLLTICQEIARLPSNHFSSKYEHSQLVEQILHFAKLCFLRDPDGHEFLPTYDTLQSRLELLKRIFNADCGIEVNLYDLGKQSKTRQIRDSLIEADQMELALDVATTCRIEREPVWTEWGLSLLSLGMYQEARDKFRHCAAMPHSQKQQLLAQVIQRLQMPSRVKHAQFLSMYSEYAKHQQYLKDVVSQIRQTASVQHSSQAASEKVRKHPYLSRTAVTSHLDQQCFEEVRFYCELFKSPKDYLLFLTKQGRLVDAIDYAVNNQVPQALFVNTIVVYCHHHGLMSHLYESVSDTQWTARNQLVKPYWTASCKYFDKKNAVQDLYQLQSFMEDDARCALTCIRVFLTQLEYLQVPEEQLAHQLSLAKSHFGKALQQTVTRRKYVLSPEDIANYIQTVNLQMDILQSQSLFKKLRQEKLSLFGSERKKKKVASIMLEDSPSFALRVINTYNLPAVKLYQRALKSLTVKKKQNDVEGLMKSVLGTLSPEEKDAVVESLIHFLVKEQKNIRAAEKHISKLTSDSKMVRACLMCHKYKAAYVIATRASNREKKGDIKQILKFLKHLPDEGGKSGRLVQQHCRGWLEKAGAA